MAYCPIMSYQRMDDPYAKHSCMGEKCALYDDMTNSCLIRTFLITQIEKSDIIVPSKKKEAANEIERFVHPGPGY